jgi:hypothetical protein
MGCLMTRLVYAIGYAGYLFSGMSVSQGLVMLIMMFLSMVWGFIDGRTYEWGS